MDLYHTPKPFFRPKKKRWYVQLDGRHVNLGPDEQAATARYHEIMAQRAREPEAPPPAPSDHPLVVTVYDQYLDWLSKRVAEGSKGQRTYDWYKRYITSFARFKGEGYRVRDLTTAELEPIHVYQWTDAHPGWKSTRGAMVAVQRPLAWAAKAGLLKSVGGKSPLANLEKPQQGRREQLVTDDEYRDILSVLTCDEARDLLEVSWETGMRPAELYSFEARFFEPEAGRIVFPIRLSKGRKHQRVVYLNDRALEIVKRRVLRFPEGPVMRNADGIPWNMSSTNCLFQRVRVNLGRRLLQSRGLVPPKVPRLKVSERGDRAKRAEQNRQVLARRAKIKKMAWELGTKYSIYVLRHAWVTEALVNGLDAVTVSVLAGHRDTTMISRHYAHVDQQFDHMRKAVNRAKGDAKSA